MAKSRIDRPCRRLIPSPTGIGLGRGNQHNLTACITTPSSCVEQQGARRRSTGFRCGQRLGQRDHLIELRKPKVKPDWTTQAAYEQVPDTLKVRELRTGGKILMTTLHCPRRSNKAALKALYRDSWHVELDLRNIKTTRGMEMLSCRTPAMAEKEVRVSLLAYNLIRLLMAQAASLADLNPRQLSFKHTLQL